MHIPHKWLLIKIDTDEYDFHGYKLFVVWYGGFLDGDAWRLNSGISSVSFEDNLLNFHGFSGSIYKCYPNTYGTNAYGLSVLRRWQKEIEGEESSLIILSEDEAKEVIEKQFGVTF